MNQGDAICVNTVCDWPSLKLMMEKLALDNPSFFYIQISRNNDAQFVVRMEIQADDHNKKQDVKKPILIPPGIYDLYW